MVVISSSTFRTNQSKYFDLAANGESVIVTRNNRPCVVVSAVSNFEARPTDEITTRLTEALKEVAAMRSGAQNSVSARSLLDEL